MFRVIKTNLMHCLSSVYFVNQPLRVSGIFVGNHQEVYCIYRVSQEKCARLRESVCYVKVYRYNPKHLYPKLNGYGDNGQRKVWSSCGSTYSTC
jgi:hypothetical protein